MKVVHVGYEHSKDDTRIVRKECLSLAKAGYEVSFVTSGKNSEPGLYDEGIPCSVLPLRGKAKARFLRYLRDVYRELLARDADIYHFHEFVLLPVALKMKRRGKKVIYDMHEMTGEQVYPKYRKRYGSFIAARIRSFIHSYERYAVSRLDYALTVTPYAVRYLQEFSKNVQMVTNYPLLLEPYEPPDLNNDALCFTGNIGDDWHQEEVMAALDMVPQARYNLAGYATEAYIDKMKQHPSWARTSYFGLISHKEALALQHRSSIGIGIHTSGQIPKEGSLGITKIYEYMASGLPVICSAYTLWKEMIKKWQCGLVVEAGDVDGLSKAILTLLEDKEKARRMGQRGRKAAEEEYNWKSQEKHLLEVYEYLSQI